MTDNTEAPLRRNPVAPASPPTSPEAPRDTWPAVWKGFRMRCPNCGNGPLLRGYLKVRDHCPVCREPYHHHRADDGPAYLTILVVGHVMAPALHIGFVVWRPDPLILLTVLSIGAIAMSLYLLPRLKGAVVGFQWARRMHGFAQAPTA
ncbi:hypothetical protein AL036_11015 [Salipiger aestuarii]|uniref:DUF983 domain-containing protein n=1 Tax=Salipiger aestuarii TaxID=568098 RepID=UPI00123A2D19|nr:DUF983 domain-containing protein [Salipiger aestuarii]KAA8607413.1 hypothetical protein AL036_11015 [Salipiger aestuarii]